MHARVDGKSRGIAEIADLDLALVTDQREIGYLDMAERRRIGIHPETILVLRIARRDMPGDALVETEFRKQAEWCGPKPAIKYARTTGRRSLGSPDYDADDPDVSTIARPPIRQAAYHA